MNQGAFQVWMGVFQHAMATYITEQKHPDPRARASMAAAEADAAAAVVSGKIDELIKVEQQKEKGNIVVPNFTPPKDILGGKK